MRTFSRDDLRRTLDADEPIVLTAVLDRDHFKEVLLPQAINVPIGKSFGRDLQGEVPDKSREVVICCANINCDASPKAAAQMERLGYEQVIGYSAGQEDWRDAGFSVERGSQ